MTTNYDQLIKDFERTIHVEIRNETDSSRQAKLVRKADGMLRDLKKG